MVKYTHMNKVLFKWFLFFSVIGLIIINFNSLCLFTDYRLLKIVFGAETAINLEDSYIKIPEIGLNAPVVFIDSKNEKDMEKALEKGVLHYPLSALPGEEGTSIFLGHSAPSNWPKQNNFYWVFSELNSLNKGDTFSLYFNNVKYFYRIEEKHFLKKGQEMLDLNNNLILISCWPPGKNSERIVIGADLR